MDKHEGYQPNLKAIPEPPLPVVLMFQPKKYEVVTGERLKEWERLLAKEVGLGGGFSNFSGTATIMFCGPDLGSDGCDGDR